MTTEMIFNRKDDARKVNRRLRDFGVLSRVVGRALVMEVPTQSTTTQVWNLAKRLHSEGG